MPQTDTSLRNLRRELAALAETEECAYAVDIKEVLTDAAWPHKDKPGTFGAVIIVMELCERGDLFSFLSGGGSPFQEPLARTFLGHLLQALKHAHDRGVSHRDIKPENLLVDGGGSLRVSDWGWCAVEVDAHAWALKTRCGTVSEDARFRGQGMRGSDTSMRMASLPHVIDCSSSMQPLSFFARVTTSTLVLASTRGLLASCYL